MKIAIICEYLSYVGGGERVYCSWANIFADKLGYDVTIVSLENWNKPFYKLSPKVKIVSLKLRPPHFYKNPAKRKRQMIVKYLFDKSTIERHVNDNNYDIILGIALNINLLIAKINGPFIKIATEHSEFYAPNKLLRWVRNRLYSHFDALTVLNSADYKLFSKYNGNSHVMLNPVEALKSSPSPSSLDNQLIISVGSLSPQKNQVDLISMMDILTKEFPNWKLRIYGEGPLKEFLTDRINSLHLDNVVELAGVTHDVQSSIREGSIFVLSSEIEGFGLVLIEAMSVGLPCVSYKTAGPEMLIDSGKNGILVPKSDVLKLYEAVKTLIENRSLRQRIGSSGLNSIQQYHPDRVAIAWQKLFEELLKNR